MIKKPKYLAQYTEADWDELNKDLNDLDKSTLYANKYQLETLLHYSEGNINEGAIITLKKRLDRINKLIDKPL